MIDDFTVDGDLGMQSRPKGETVVLSYPSVILSTPVAR